MPPATCTHAWVKRLKDGVIWAAMGVQGSTGLYMPWLTKSIANHVDLCSHRGPVRPEFYTDGMPSMTWICLACGRMETIKNDRAEAAEPGAAGGREGV